MPHLILETTKTLSDKISSSELFSQLHTYLAVSLPTSIATCKSRVMGYESYHLAEGAPGKHYIHLTIKALPGRSDEILTHAGKGALELLQRYGQKTYPDLDVDYSVEFAMLSPFYFKS